MKYIIVVAITFLVTMSCEDDFLDRSPYDSISSANIWKTDVNAQRGVNGIYHALDHFRSAGQNFMWAFSNFGPDGTTFNGGAIIQGNSTSRSSNWLGNDYRAYYTEMYRIIRFSNDAIANLTDNPNISEDLRKRLIGEAKFFRGFGYFYLWDLFGDVVLIKEPVKPDETDKARAPASEVKKLIVSDFKDARDRLPVTYEESNRGRVTQGAAVAMLGKTYLYDKDYKDAADVFENLMSSPYEYALHPEYYQLFNFKWEYNDEVIFAIDEIMLPGLGNEYDMRYGNRSTNTGGWNNSLATYTAVDNYTHRDGSPINMSTMPQRDDYKTGGEVDEVAYGEALIDWYQATFTKEDVDKRLHANIIMPGFTFIGDNNQKYMVKWPYAEHANDSIPALRTNWSGQALYPWRKFVHGGEENKERRDSPNNLPLIRYADVLLMYAEAKNESEGVSDAVYSAVNEVRNRAEVDDLPGGLSKSEMRRKIWRERMKELAGEGHLFFDVRRWKTAATNDSLFGLNHDVLDFRGIKLYSQTFEEKHYLWPIPEAEIERTDNIEQNEGWGQ